MGKEKKLQLRVIAVIVGLVAMLLGGILVAGVMNGWFDDSTVILDPEYQMGDGEIKELSPNKYKELVSVKKSFVVFIDQGGCTTADRMQGFVTEYAKAHNLLIYKMMFSEMKETAIHEMVKYYPSVVIVSKGEVVGYLRADNDEDAEMYNDYEAFEGWMNQWLAFDAD